MELAGARIWIVGASSGIGASLASALVSAGSSVAISARRADALETVSRGRMHCVTADVTSADSLAAAADSVRDALGGIDVAIFNAGIWLPIKIDNFGLAPYQQSMDTNFFGLIRGIEAVLPAMLSAGSGRIVGVASVAGYRGMPRASPYGATKAAEINLLESLRGELAPRGIVVQTVNPGFVATPLTAVNTFPMPFIVSAQRAAAEIIRGIEKDKSEIVFPKRMAATMKIARLVPGPLWTRLMFRSSRRP